MAQMSTDLQTALHELPSEPTGGSTLAPVFWSKGEPAAGKLPVTGQ